MFTVLSKTRNSSLFLIGALIIAVVALLTLAVVPAISAPAARISEAGSDYYERHPELRVPTALVTDMAGDFYLRHPEWASNIQNTAIAVTGNSETSDVATPLAESLKTPELACESPVDCR